MSNDYIFLFACLRQYIAPNEGNILPWRDIFLIERDFYGNEMVNANTVFQIYSTPHSTQQNHLCIKSFTLVL